MTTQAIDLSESVKRGDPTAFVEAIHRIDLDEGAWLDGMASSLDVLLPGCVTRMGVAASWRDGVPGLQMEQARFSDAELGKLTVDRADQVAPNFVADFFGGCGRVTLISEALARGASSPPLTRIMQESGAADLLTLTAMSAQTSGGRGVALALSFDRNVRFDEESRVILDRYGSHLAAVYRLRMAGPGSHTEGVLAPDGRVLHAEGEAHASSVRETLQRAVVAIERARRREARTTDPAALLDAWRALYEQRWTLVAQTESDGRRLLLAHVNTPPRHPEAALSPREQQVAALLVHGASQKAIAYELELSASTVAFHVRNIVQKLGALSATDAVRMLSASMPHGPRGSSP